MRCGGLFGLFLLLAMSSAQSAPCLLPGDKLGDELPPPPQRHCPLLNVPLIRPGDGCAKEGGDFLSRRIGGKGQSGYHRAYDLNAAQGTAVFAAQDGCVAIAAQSNWGGLDPKKGMGKTVVIRHEGGTYSLYGHLDTVLVSQNQRVNAGEQIGTVGTTGNASCLAEKKLTPHLHFAVIQHHTNDLFLRDRPLAQTGEWEAFWDNNFFGENIANGVQRPDILLAGLSCWSRPNDTKVPSAPTGVSVQ